MEADVARVRRALPRLESLRLAYNRLDGTLPCDLTPPGSVLTHLDASSNRLTGTLPACLLAAPMAALSLGSNGLSGWLPAPPSGCKLESLRLYAQVRQNPRI